jgi:hypothetical protein
MRATLALVHAAVLAILHPRPGLLAVALWYVEPPLVTTGAAVLLASAFMRSRRHREGPTARELIGYLTLAALIGSLVAFRTYPSSFDDRPSEVRFRLPLDGPVAVGWGGTTLAVNYHAIMPDQRWAYDLHLSHEGRTFRNDGTRLDDYYGYGRPVHAPADGVVRAIHDGDADGRIGQWSFLRAAGNHVVLEVAQAEYCSSPIFRRARSLSYREIASAPERSSVGSETQAIAASRTCTCICRTILIEEPFAFA